MNGKAERIRTYYISGNFFSTLGMQPATGRFILPSEGETPGADPVMVLSYTYWKERFGGDPEIVGTKVSVDGQPVTIVGVAPEDSMGSIFYRPHRLICRWVWLSTAARPRIL